LIHCWCLTTEVVGTRKTPHKEAQIKSFPVFTGMRSTSKNQIRAPFSRAESRLLSDLPRAYVTEIRKFRDHTQGPVRFADIRSYFAGLRCSASTRRVAKYAIKKLMRLELMEQGRTEDIVKLDPFFREIKTGSSSKRVLEADLITDQEIDRIRRDARPKTALLCELLFQTGLRISELAGVNLSDCDVRGDVVHVHIIGKGNKERRIMMSSRLYDRAVLLFAGKSHLCGSKSGGPISSRYLRRVVTESRGVLGRAAWPHLFRHSFCTNAIAKTGKIKAVSEYVGHSSPAITLAMYLHESITINDLRALGV